MYVANSRERNLCPQSYLLLSFLVIVLLFSQLLNNRELSTGFQERVLKFFDDSNSRMC